MTVSAAMIIRDRPAAAGRSRMIIAAETVINRRDYGLGWNGALIRAADDVAITLAIEAHPAEAAGG